FPNRQWVWIPASRRERTGGVQPPLTAKALSPWLNPCAVNFGYNLNDQPKSTEKRQHQLRFPCREFDNAVNVWPRNCTSSNRHGDQVLFIHLQSPF
ncbi:hypothetical protein, partial [uncultured Roseibium sp.]|uniref:hypothetical protein n=1 Tax=uncultured Roseibium sp. TaxID=1936171 RepID=UPI00261A4458